MTKLTAIHHHSLLPNILNHYNYDIITVDQLPTVITSHACCQHQLRLPYLTAQCLKLDMFSAKLSEVVLQVLVFLLDFHELLKCRPAWASTRAESLFRDNESWRCARNSRPICQSLGDGKIDLEILVLTTHVLTKASAISGKHETRTTSEDICGSVLTVCSRHAGNAIIVSLQSLEGPGLPQRGDIMRQGSGQLHAIQCSSSKTHAPTQWWQPWKRES